MSIGSDTYQRDESGGLVSQSTVNGREYFHLDALGSVRALTGAAGSTTRTFDYDPYGTATSTDKPGATTSRFGYASGEYIHQGGLYHYGQRYYDPAIHRWTTPDPLLNHDDLRQANRYAYVGGDPINALDPSGEAFLPAALAAARLAVWAAPRALQGLRHVAAGGSVRVRFGQSAHHQINGAWQRHHQVIAWGGRVGYPARSRYFGYGPRYRTKYGQGD